METRMLKLQSGDGKDFEVEEAVAMKSEMVRGLMEDIEDADDVPIILPNVEADILKLVIEYCMQHVKTDKTAEQLEKWDKQFVDTDHDTLFEIILAANYLNVKDLLDLSCEHVANMIKGKTAEQIRETFDIENDFSPEEEEEIRKENEWQIVD